MTRRLFYPVILFVLSMCGGPWPARGAMNQILEESGDHVFPDVITFGTPAAYDCTTLTNGKVGSKTVPNGSEAGCKNCLPGSDPAACGTDGFGHTGCLVEREDGRWKCIGSLAVCADVGASCSTNTQCCTGVCSGGVCVAPCSPVGTSCSTNGQCCTDLCTAGSCALPTTSSTSTTTTTTSSTTTTTGGGGGICTPDPAVPVEERALRTVATSGTCQDNWLPFCDARNYGAVGDRTTDDTAALTAAIQACEVGANGTHKSCSQGGTVYLRGTAGRQFKITTQLRACGVRFLGEGESIFDPQSEIFEATQLGTCEPSEQSANLRGCTPAVDLWGPTVEIANVAFTGPGSASIVPGTHTADVDGINMNASQLDLRHVTIQQFDNGLVSEFEDGGSWFQSGVSVEMDDVTFSSNFNSIVNGGGVIWRRVFFQAARYAHLFMDTFTGPAGPHVWEVGSMDAAPYLILQDDDFGTVDSRRKLLQDAEWIDVCAGAYGNGGIISKNYSIAADGEGGADVQFFHWKVNQSGLCASALGQNNGYKIGSLPVDKAIRWGRVYDVEVRPTPTTFGSDCYVEYLAGGLTFHNGAGETPAAGGIPTGSGVGVGFVPTCTINGGFPAYAQMCTQGEGQCFRNAIPTFTTATTALNVGSVIERFFVALGGAASIQDLSIGTSSTSLGRHVQLFFQNGNTTLVHHAHGATVTTEMSLKGGVDVTPTAGDVIDFVNDGTNWREVFRNF